MRADEERRGILHDLTPRTVRLSTTPDQLNRFSLRDGEPTAGRTTPHVFDPAFSAAGDDQAVALVQPDRLVVHQLETQFPHSSKCHSSSIAFSSSIFIAFYTSFCHIKKTGLRAGGLPANIHILTLEPWRDGTHLLRLEHVFDIGEHLDWSEPVELDLEVSEKGGAT